MKVVASRRLSSTAASGSRTRTATGRPTGARLFARHDVQRTKLLLDLPRSTERAFVDQTLRILFHGAPNLKLLLTFSANKIVSRHDVLLLLNVPHNLTVR